jgi:hypothetical protein
MKRIGCMIEQDLSKKVKLRCLELDITITEYLTNLIKKDLETKKDIRK